MHTHTRLLPRLHLVQLCLLMLCAFLLTLMTTGCLGKRAPVSFDAAMLNSMGASSNKVLTVIQGGRQASSMFDKESVLPAFAHTAQVAIENGQEVSISSGVYGGLRAPKIDRMVDRETKVQDGVSKLVAAGMMQAKSGSTPNEAALKLLAEGGKTVGEALFNDNEEGATSDESGLQFLTLSAGPDANKYHSENVRAGFATRQAVALADRPSLTSVEKIVEEDITTSNAWNSVNLGIAAAERIAAQEARLEELRLLREQSKREGRIVDEVITDSPADDTKPAPDKPSAGGRPSYDSLEKKNFIYKTRLAANRPVTRHDAAVLIPLDRPKPTSIYIPGQTLAEPVYESESEKRWILRMKGALPNTPAAILVTYADGNSETFNVPSLAGRTDRPAGPYPHAAAPAPVTPDPVTPPVTPSNEFSTIPAP